MTTLIACGCNEMFSLTICVVPLQTIRAVTAEAARRLRVPLHPDVAQDVLVSEHAYLVETSGGSIRKQRHQYK